MSTYTTVRAMVGVEVADSARAKAEAEGLTLAEKVAQLLAAYASDPKPRKRAARKRG